MMKILAAVAPCLVFTATACIHAQARNTPVLQLTETITLPGVTGGFDHFAYDPQHNQLFLAAEDHGTVEVIDLNRGRRVGTIPGFKNPHSILFRSGGSTLLVTIADPSLPHWWTVGLERKSKVSNWLSAQIAYSSTLREKWPM